MSARPPRAHMPTTRLEAFSDGVVAIIITIMVLELKPPHDVTPAALVQLLPTFLSYVLSFVYVGLYWNNHHHLFHVTRMVTGGVLWANLHLLFWLSLIPFVTAWMGENHFAAWPVALYGVVLLMSAVAFVVLTTVIVRAEGGDSPVATAIGHDWKGRLSVAIYLVAIAAAFFVERVAELLYAVVAAIWLVPDRRIERALAAHAPSSSHSPKEP